MTKPDSTKRLGIESTYAGKLQRNLAQVLREKPLLTADRSHFLDLVQEDYHRLAGEGPAPAPDEYCAYLGVGDSALRASVRRLVEVEKYYVENPSLVPEIGEPNWPKPGGAFAGFDLVEELGRGAVSRVFLARDPRRGNRRVVVKVTTLATDEAEVLGRADRRGVVPIHWNGSVDGEGLHWLCMPYHGRRTLLDEIDDAEEVGIDTDRVLRIGARLAGILAGLSDVSIFHGDLKPSNVLLLDDDEPMLIDFNLSQAGTAKSVLVGGTLPYMAPEVLRRLVATHHEQTAVSGSEALSADVFSFGCLLFQLQTGRHWVQPDKRASTPESLALSMLDAQLDSQSGLGERLSDAPEAFSQLVRSCVSLSPSGRPRAFREIERTLNSLISASKPARPRWLSTVALLTCLVASSTAVTLWWRPAPDVQSIGQAASLIDAGDISHAREVLSAVKDRPSLPVWSRRELGASLLAVGRHAEASDLFASLGDAFADTADYALAGYASHMAGNHKLAISFDRQALLSGDAITAVQNNLAAGLISRLTEHFDRDESSEVHRLLVAASSGDPRSPAICRNVLRHVEILMHRGLSHDYPVVDLLGRIDLNNELDIAIMGIRYLARVGSPGSAPPPVGTAMFARLLAVLPNETLADAIGNDRFAEYMAMTESQRTPGTGVAPVAQIAAQAGRVFIDPSDATGQ